MCGFHEQSTNFTINLRAFLILNNITKMVNRDFLKLQKIIHIPIEISNPNIIENNFFLLNFFLLSNYFFINFQKVINFEKK